jgi:hypothetical protein
MTAMRNAYRVVVVKPEGKMPVEKLKTYTDDNIKIDL